MTLWISARTPYEDEFGASAPRQAVLLSRFVPTEAPSCLPCAAVSPAPPPRDPEVVDCCRGEGCLGTAVALESDRPHSRRGTDT